MKRRGRDFYERRKRIAQTVILFAAALMLVVRPVMAIDDATLDKYAANDIMFYDPEDGNCIPASMPSGDKMTWIGDSLSESVLDKIEETFPGVDTKEKIYDGTTYRLVRYSKFVDHESETLKNDGNYSGLTTARQLVDHKEMREYLVFPLGTNGSITAQNIEDLISIVGENVNILLVTNYGLHSDYTANNDAIKKAAEEKENVAYADWYEIAKSDPSGYIDDSDGLGVHLSDSGKEQFINVIKEAFTQAYGSGSSAGRSDKKTLGGDNTNYAGEQVWSDEELAKIEENRPFYEAAAAKYGVPWQAIATMHSLEYSLQRANPANGQGIYQLYTYTAGGTNSNAFLPAGPVSDDEFARQTDIATSIMKDMIESAGLDVASDEGIKSLLFQYNGTASVYKQKALDMGFSQEEADWGEGSAYVMNRYDERRDPASPNMDSHWPGRFVADGVYDPSSTSMGFGGFVKYIALGGGGGNTCRDSGDLIGKVRGYVWPEHHDAPYHDRMPDYAEVVDSKRIPSGLYVGGSVGGVNGIDCGGFVTTLLNESGFDPEYNYGGDTSKGASNVNGGQVPYVLENPDKWEMINSDWNTPISDESQLSPGDVAYSNCSTVGTASENDCGHTYVYIGEVEGYETHIASASYSTHGSGRAPMSGYEAIIQDSNGPIRWFHKK